MERERCSRQVHRSPCPPSGSAWQLPAPLPRERASESARATNPGTHPLSQSTTKIHQGQKNRISRNRPLQEEQHWEEEAAAGQRRYWAPKIAAAEPGVQRDHLGGRAWARDRQAVLATALAGAEQHWAQNTAGFSVPSTHGGRIET